MCIGTGLVIVFKMLGGLRIMVVRHALRGWAWTALGPVAARLIATSATTGVGCTTVGVRRTGRTITTGF